MKNLIVFALFVFVFIFEAKAQNNGLGEPPPETYVYRNNKIIEKLIIRTNIYTNQASEIQYQVGEKTKPIILKIIRIDKKARRVYTQHPITKKELIFDNEWTMGGRQIMPDGSVKEFFNEYLCYAKTGEIIISANAPMYAPFHYAPNDKTAFSTLKATPSATTEGFEVQIPNKKGKYEIVPLPLQQDYRIRLHLVAPDGTKTLFEAKI